MQQKHTKITSRSKTRKRRNNQTEKQAKQERQTRQDRGRCQNTGRWTLGKDTGATGRRTGEAATEQNGGEVTTGLD